MARKSKSSSKTTSTNSVMPSDNLDSAATPPLASSQEASTPVQATASNATKKSNSKTRSTVSPVTTTPSDPNHTAALLARVAEQQAEIDRLRKATQSMAQDTKSKEIKRPLGSISNLQRAMGLESDKALYMTCRSTISDALAHAGIPLDVDWRRQDFISLGKVASVAKARNKQLQFYESNWAALEIMKTIIKNKRSYRNKIGRQDTNNRDNQLQELCTPDQAQGSGSQQAGAGGVSDSSTSDGTSDEEENGDNEGNKENNDAEGDGSGAGSAGTKRKATGSGGSGGKGKQRKV